MGRRSPIYDEIGRGYAVTRRPDPRIARAIGHDVKIVGAENPVQLVGVSRLGESTARRLASGPRVIGRVHSVFERAVNILGADGHLVTLHGPGLLAAPFAVALAERLRARDLEPGLPVEREGLQLTLGALRLDCSAAQVVDMAVGASADPGVLVAALADASRRPPAPSLSSPVALEGRRRLAEGLRRGDASRFADGARRLIGLGEGLTPAGDDLLVGTLAVARRFRPAFLLDNPTIGRALADTAREDTTLVAREFLLEALEGRFSEIVIALLTAADAPRARTALDDLLELGATSGADTAAGMRLALGALY